jgi:hypothetical protein
MTKKLEELFNLPESQEIISDDAKKEKKKIRRSETAQQKTFEQLAEFDKISAALPAVNGLGELADQELNVIAEKALQAYEDLMNLGMNVESRYSGRMFEVAGNMLKTGLDAKVAKFDKKLKMIELQLKKEKQDKEENPSGNGLLEGQGYVISDRNSLIARLKNEDKDK